MATDRIPVLRADDNAESFDTLRTRALLKGSLEIVPPRDHTASRSEAIRRNNARIRFMAGLPEEDEDEPEWRGGKQMPGHMNPDRERE